MHDHVFIDTNVFVAKRFDFQGDLFRTLTERAQAGGIRIVLPDVIVREIRAKADELVENGVSELQRALRRAPVLEPLGLPYSTLGESLEVGAAKEKVQANISKFLTDAQVVV